MEQANSTTKPATEKPAPQTSVHSSPPSTPHSSPHSSPTTPETKSDTIKEIVRILNTDIRGDMNIYSGLVRIKGISWRMSSLILHTLKMDKQKKVGLLTNEEIKKIENAIKTIPEQVPPYLLNRPKIEGVPKHLVESDLDLQIKMDVRRLREIGSYRGLRHALGLPVRGQRTKAHFRHGKAVGVVKKKIQQQAAKKSKPGKPGKSKKPGKK